VARPRGPRIFDPPPGAGGRKEIAFSAPPIALKDVDGRVLGFEKVELSSDGSGSERREVTPAERRSRGGVDVRLPECLTSIQVRVAARPRRRIGDPRSTRYASRNSFVDTCVYTSDMTNRAKIFTNGGSQAVRLPKEVRFPESQREVLVRRSGRQVILEPADEWPGEFVAAMGGWSEPIERPKKRVISRKRDPLA